MAVCLAALALAGSAPAADVGANDDTGKFAADSGAVFFGQMGALGLKQSVMTTRFIPSDPTTIQDGEALDRAIPVAELAGLHVALAVYPYPPREIEDGTATPAAFATWLTLVAQRYPTVHQYVVMNEPNQPAFLRPQFGPTGKIVSAARAGAFLAAGYDALKAVDPTIQVIGLGLSPRGNDQPTATSNVSTSPVRFLAALGAWYRASGRSLPLMDGLSFHPYPDQAIDPLERGYRWPKAGFANLDRIKQAMWDAFRETPQPTTVNGLKLYLDEVGLAGRHVDADRVHGHRERPRHERCHAGARLLRAGARRRLRPADRGGQHLRLLRRRPARQRLPGGAEPRRRHAARLGRGGAGGDRRLGERAAPDARAWWVPAKRVIGAVAPVWARRPDAADDPLRGGRRRGRRRRRLPHPGRARRRGHGGADGASGRRRALAARAAR